MNKIKDILYDKNDILVALLIVAIAALVIYTRIEVIMDYPQIQAAAAESSSQAETKDKTSAQKTNRMPPEKMNRIRQLPRKNR